MFACLAMQHFLIKPKVSMETFKKISFIDKIYGLSAIVTLVCGFLLWFVVGKPAIFYMKNAILHTKITLFFIMGLISIYPTFYFIKNRKLKVTEIEIPKKIIMFVRVELLIFIVLPLLANLMASGIGNK